MKTLWFIGGIAVAAVLVVGIGAVAAYSGKGAENRPNTAIESARGEGCGCSHGAEKGGCGAAGCASGCSQCEKGCGGGCSGGCTK